MRNQRTLGPFLGLMTSLDPEQIPDGAASDCLNVRLEDGVMRQRYGFRNINPAPTGFQSSYGFFYLDGYNSSYANVQEYLSLEKRSGTVKPYSASPATGARTELTNNGVSLTLDQTNAQAFVYNDTAYVVTPGASNSGNSWSLYSHKLGVNNNYTPIKVAADPTQAPVFALYDTQTDTDTTPKTMNWDNGSILADTAVSINTGSQFSKPTTPVNGYSTGKGIFQILQGVDYTNPTEGFVVTLDGTNGPGQQNWSNNDRIVIPINGPVWIDPNSIQIQLENAAGTILKPDQITVLGPAPAVFTYDTYVCILDFKYKTNRADFAAIKKIHFQWQHLGGSYTDSQMTNPGLFQISPIQIGNIDSSAVDSHGNPCALKIAITYSSSVTGQETGLSKEITLTPAQLGGTKIADPWKNGTYYMGRRLKLYLKKDTGLLFDGLYDTYNVYARADDSTNTTWYKAASVALGATTSSGSNNLGGTAYDATFDYQIRWADLVTGAIKASGGTFPTGNLACGCVFKGWVVWGYQGGGGPSHPNIRHSAQGNPLQLYSNTSPTLLSTDVLTRPADFSLSDGFDDDPLAITACGNSLIILGSKGVYEQTGNSPSTMTPPVRVPSSLGCNNAYSWCRWHDDMGNPSVVFLARNGEGIYMLVSNHFWGAEERHRVIELTAEIRGLVKSFLKDAQGLTDYSSLRIGIDETLDALWVVMGANALVLRRPSVIDGKRHWEKYTFNLPGIANLGFSVINRLRWIRTTGEIDEAEWNSSTGAWITGASSDSGAAMPQPYWTSKKFTGYNRRIDLVRVDREALSDSPSITCASTRETTTKQPAAGKYQFRFGAYQQGHEHTFKIALADGSGGIRRVVVDEVGPLGRRTNG